MGILQPFCCCLFLIVILQTTHGVQMNDDLIQEIESHLYHLEERIDSEAKIRRESDRSVLRKLYDIKEKIGLLNLTSNGPPLIDGHRHNQTQIINKNQDNLLYAVLKAFEAEKINNRRVERDVQNLMIANENRLKGQLDDIGETLKDIVQSNRDSVKNTKDFGQRLNEFHESYESNSRDILNGLKSSEIVSNLKDLEEELSGIKTMLTTQYRRYESCVELKQDGFTKSGLYDIYPDDRSTPIRVFCDQQTDHGGWIVFQRREDGSENFYRTWLEYKFGFGNLEGEFWLGNEYIHLLTTNCCHELRIDMEDFDNEHRYAKYSNFSIGSKNSNYKLTAQGYTGTAGDSLGGHSGHAFSTHDKDNDANSGNCAVSYKGAWWYTSCHSSNLNGKYLNGKHESYADGVNWRHWKDYHYSMKRTAMKLR